MHSHSQLDSESPTRVSPAPDARWDADAPLPTQADVVVIGGGVAGTSTAYQLARRGKQVVLLDMRGICSGASGRNCGMTGGGTPVASRTGQAVYHLSSENLRLIRDELPPVLGSDFDLRLNGVVDIATTEEMWEHHVVGVRLAQEQGGDAQLLDHHELASMMPIADSVLGARYSEHGGHLWPFALVNALASGARAHGATLMPWTPAEELLITNGKVTGVRTSRGTIATDTVVLATNAYTPLLLPDLPPGAIVPARGQILVTQPVGTVLPLTFGTNFDKEYGRQTATGQLLCGGFRRLDVDEGLGHYTEEVMPEVLAGIASCLAGIFPRVGHLRVVRAWAGIMGFTADGLPMIGPYGGAEGLFLNAGFNGGGFSWGCATGDAIAELIVDGESRFDLQPFDPSRFSNGNVAWDNPYTAGEKNNPRSPESRAERLSHADA